MMVPVCVMAEPVDDAPGVRRVERQADRHSDLYRALREERPALDDDRFEIAALHVLHDDVVGAVLDAPVEDVHYVRLIQVGRRLGLVPEPLNEHRVFRELRVKDLDRDRPAQEVVASPVYIGHSAGANQLFELITGVENSSDHRREDLSFLVMVFYIIRIKVSHWYFGSPCGNAFMETLTGPDRGQSYLQVTS
jgi:hypothetical protein